MKKIIIFTLTVCLVISAVMPVSFASDALGSDRMERTIELGAGTTLTENSFWSATYSDLRTEHYVSYDPCEEVSAMVWYGSTVVGTSSVSSAASSLESQGYRVLAAINGGFFNPDGTAVGLLISDGVIRCMDQWNYSMLGIREDGTMFVDRNTIVKQAEWVTQEEDAVCLSVTAINESRENGGLYLFSEDFGSTTQNTLGGVDVILEPVDENQKLAMNSALTLRVVQVIDSTQDGVESDNRIPAGSYVLSANKNCSDELLNPLREMEEGTEVTITISGGSDQWKDAVYGVTALYSLVEDGTVTSGLEAGAAPRTAVGIRADGSVILYTIDGRQSGYSVGASYTQVAERLIELGCVEAVALDGGGSTTMGVTLPGSTSFSVINAPSDGSERAVHNCILLVTKEPSSGIADRFYVSAESSVILSGSKMKVEAVSADSMGYPASYQGTVTWESEGGTFSYDEQGNLIFTAGKVPGVYEVTVCGEGISGSVSVRVVDELSKLTVSREDTGSSLLSLVLQGEDTVNLTASGSWYNLPVAMDDLDVSWSADSEIGRIDETGCFTATDQNATGFLRVSAGNCTVSIPVTVRRNEVFIDVTYGSYYYDAVQWALENGITTGTSESTFSPEEGCTRGQTVTFLWRAAGSPAPESGENPFADVAEDAYYYDAVEWAVENGITTGTSESTFSPEETCTRAQVVTFLWRAAGSPQADSVSQFSDLSGDAYYYDAVEWAVENGITNGTGESTFSPDDACTRAQIVTFLYRDRAEVG